MALTGPAPFAGYPDYENRGDYAFDGNIYAAYSGDSGGVLFTAGAGQTSQVPVSCGLYCDGRFLSSTYGPAGTSSFPWGQDTLGLSGFGAAPWTLNLTWKITRTTFDGSLTSPLQVVATNAAPNGWAVTLSLLDVVAACQHPVPSCDPAGFTYYVGPFAGSPHISADGVSVGYNGGTLFTFETRPSQGSFTFTSPSGAPYGVYAFSCTADYHLTQAPGPYRPPLATPLNATFTLTCAPPPACIQTGAGHLTITNDPDYPTPMTLSGSAGNYSITGTGPVYSSIAPRPPHRLLDIQLIVDGMPSESAYLGPKLLSPALPIPPGDGTIADLTAYKASHTDPNRSPGAMVDYGTVLLPADAPNGAAIYRWKMLAPYYAGHTKAFFIPVSSFGPVYVYPYQSGDVSDIGNGVGGMTRTLLPPSPTRLYTTLQEVGLVPPFVATLDINITPWTTTTPASTGPDPQDAGDTAQDTATGRTTQVGSLTTGTAPALVTTLTAQAWEGWQNVAGALARPLASILDATGQPVQGKYPSLWKTSEEGRYSLCYQDAMGFVTRAVSLDGLSTLMSFPLILFTTASGAQRTGGRPGHTQDGSTGVYYVAAAFTLLDSAGHPTGNEDILVARVDATDTILRWADGTMQKTVVLNTAAAGRPSLILSRYDPAQPVLLLHGSRKFLGQNGGETWAEITT